MKLKHTKVVTLAAALITFGSLAGGANAAVTIDIEGVPGSNVTTWTFSGSYDIFLFDDPLDGQFSFSGAQERGEPNYYSAGIGDWTGEITSDAHFPNDEIGMTVQTAVMTGSSSGVHFIDGLHLDSDAANGGDDFGWFADGDFAQFETITLSGTSTAPIDITMFGEGITAIQNAGDSFSINNSSDTDNKGIITLNFTAAVPEPSSAFLLGLGALGMVARRKRTS